jgi:hypothetical protein
MRIKSFKLFESYNDEKVVIKNLLLDFIHSDIDVKVTHNYFNFDNRFHEYHGLPFIRVEIGDGVKMFNLSELGVSILEVIDYCESQDLFLMDDSSIYSPHWQNYEGCPRCLSDDLSNKKGKTVCNRCGFDDVPDSFLLDDWPLTKERLGIIISEGKRISNIQLYFSKVKSVY